MNLVRFSWCRMNAQIEFDPVPNLIHASPQGDSALPMSNAIVVPCTPSTLQARRSPRTRLHVTTASLRAAGLTT